KDLQDYKVKRREPVKASFGGFEILSMSPPSSGGVHIVQMLKLAENLINDKKFDDVESIHLKAEIMRRAFADRSQFLGDPDFFKVPVAGLTSEAYAKVLAKSVDPKAAT